MAQKKYYTQNTEKKTVTIDTTVKATASEEKIVQMLIASGYKLLAKSESRSKRAAERSDSLTNEDILKALADDEKGLKKYKEIKEGKGKGKGFFAAKTWYKNTYLK